MQIKDKTFRITAFICTVMLLLSVFTCGVYADDNISPYALTEEHLVTLDQEQDLTVSFWYDVELPTVIFVSPTGEEYPVSETTEGMKVLIENSYALVQITAAKPGDWYIRYSEGKNSEFDFSLMGMTENIWIQYITVTVESGNYIRARFLSERGESRQRYSYRLYLTYVPKGNTQPTQVLLDQGTAYTGEEANRRLYMGDYNSYDEYKLLLEVELEDDDVTLFDNMESDTFSFQNSNQQSALSGMDISVNVNERMLEVNWEKYTSYRYSGYRIQIKGDNGDVIFISDLDSNSYKIKQYVSEKYKYVTVDLYGIRSGLLTKPLSKKVVISGNIKVITTSPTASSQAQIEMNIQKDQKLYVDVNGTKSEFLSSGSKNTVAVSLNNGNNVMNISYTNDGITYYIECEIFKDGIPPIIDFYEPYANMSFKDGKAVLVGSVDDAVKFTMNGTEVDINEGVFTVELQLENGANEFLFVAYDVAGNMSSYPLTLYGGAHNLPGQGLTDGNSISIWVYLAIGAGLAVLFVVFAIVLVVRKKKLKGFSTASIVVFFSGVTALALGLYIYQFIRQKQLSDVVETISFSNVVSESIERAYQLLIQFEEMQSVVDTYFTYLLIAVVCLAVSIVAHIIFKLITKYIAKRKANKNNSAIAQNQSSVESKPNAVADNLSEVNASVAENQNQVDLKVENTTDDGNTESGN